MDATSKFYFRPAAGEYIETILHYEPEKRSAICGKVLDTNERPIEGALALLYLSEGKDELISRQFTDADGMFIFGPIESGSLYMIKIYKDSIKIRELEIIAE